MKSNPRVVFDTNVLINAAFSELAVSSEADVIVTGNIRDFPSSPFQGILILRPAEFLETFDV